MAALHQSFMNQVKLLSFKANTVKVSSQINVSNMKINTRISCCLNNPKPYLSPLLKPTAETMPPKHPDALDMSLCVKPTTETSPLKSETKSDSLCMELRLSTFWKSPPLDATGGKVYPKRGLLKIHGLWSGYMDEQSRVVHYYNEKNTRLYPSAKALNAAKSIYQKDVFMQLDDDDINDLKVIWFDGDRVVTKFWANECTKHNQYSRGDYISKYYSTVRDLAMPLFDGSSSDIRTILLDEGFKVGEYHSVRRLQQVLEKHLGVRCFLSFYDHFGHPCLGDIGILYSRSGKKIHHPMASMVPEGYFLFRSVDME